MVPRFVRTKAQDSPAAAPQRPELLTQESPPKLGRHGDFIWAAWIVGIVAAACFQRFAAGRTPLLRWLERAILPLVGQ